MLVGLTEKQDLLIFRWHYDYRLCWKVGQANFGIGTLLWGLSEKEYNTISAWHHAYGLWRQVGWHYFGKAQYFKVMPKSRTSFWHGFILLAFYVKDKSISQHSVSIHTFSPCQNKPSYRGTRCYLRKIYEAKKECYCHIKYKHSSGFCSPIHQKAFSIACLSALLEWSFFHKQCNDLWKQ